MQGVFNQIHVFSSHLFSYFFILLIGGIFLRFVFIVLDHRLKNPFSELLSLELLELLHHLV